MRFLPGRKLETLRRIVLCHKEKRWNTIRGNMNKPPWGFFKKKTRRENGEFRLEKWKNQQAFLLKMKDEKGEKWWVREVEEKASNKQHGLTIKTWRGCLPGGRKLLNYCWEEARWVAPLPGCRCDCRNEGTVGMEVSSGESLSVDPATSPATLSHYSWHTNTTWGWWCLFSLWAFHSCTSMRQQQKTNK